MKPALSIVFFSVSSGAGLGLLALLALADLCLLGGGLSQRQLLIGCGVGLTLVAAGLLASTLHLANPRNAWRSFSRFRTSWLSREAVFAVLFMLSALFYSASILLWPDSTRRVAAISVVVLAWVVLYCTAMIYASLKPIRQWHTRLTPLCYFLFGHLSASLLLAWIAVLGETRPEPFLVAALVLLLASAMAKLSWLVHATGEGGPELRSALGVPTAASVKLLDAGHTHANFITNEFVFQLARTHARRLSDVFWLASFALPAMVLTFVQEALLGAALSCFAGLLVERWLFFAEARHTVNLFHGAQSA